MIVRGKKLTGNVRKSYLRRAFCFFFLIKLAEQYRIKLGTII